jgi:hypothetical protein
MKRIIYCFLLSGILITGLSDSSGAQESTAAKSHDFWHRVVVGGNIGLQIGDVTGIIISPEVAVRLVDQLYGGLGFTYQYSSFKNYYYDTKTNQYLNFKQNTYGGKIFFRYYLNSLFDNFLGNFFAHVEYEYLTYTRPYTFNPSGTILDPYANAYSYGNENVEINSLFIGGGYHQPVGGRVFLDFLILYNLNDSYNSPYSNPLFRVGFGVGL